MKDSVFIKCLRLQRSWQQKIMWLSRNFMGKSLIPLIVQWTLMAFPYTIWEEGNSRNFGVTLGRVVRLFTKSYYVREIMAPLTLTGTSVKFGVCPDPPCSLHRPLLLCCSLPFRSWYCCLFGNGASWFLVYWILVC